MSKSCSLNATLVTKAYINYCIEDMKSNNFDFNSEIK